MQLRGDHKQFVKIVSDKILSGFAGGKAPFASKTAYEKLAREYHIEDKTHAKELAEYATLTAARDVLKSLTEQGASTQEKFQSLVKLYDIQPGFTHRSSWSTIYQQYSTPIPISFAAGIWAGLDKLGCQDGQCQYAFEPSAGNGLLTVAADPANVRVNEIDKFRSAILANQGYYKLSNLDASQPENFTAEKGKYRAVISNPPFDKLDILQTFDGEEWKVLDHLMAAIALDTMAADGRAALIVGGHTQYDAKGRIRAGKNRQFLSYLYKKYKVADIINISGDLYRKQGTQFDIRLILVDGRRNSAETSYPPLQREANAAPVNSFDALWERIFQHSDMKETIPTQSRKTLQSDTCYAAVFDNENNFFLVSQPHAERILITAGELRLNCWLHKGRYGIKNDLYMPDNWFVTSEFGSAINSPSSPYKSKNAAIVAAQKRMETVVDKFGMERVMEVIKETENEAKKITRIILTKGTSNAKKEIKRSTPKDAASVLKLRLKLKARAALALKTTAPIDGDESAPEIEVSYQRPRHELPKVTSSIEAAAIFREHFNKNHIELKESMYCMLLDTKMKVLGITRISEGSRTATIADPGYILAIAAKANANAVILSHNHPSGDPKPSQADMDITKRTGSALKMIGIQLADHVIITPDSHYSFGDSDLSLGSVKLSGYPKIPSQTFVID